MYIILQLVRNATYSKYIYCIQCGINDLECVQYYVHAPFMYLSSIRKLKLYESSTTYNPDWPAFTVSLIYVSVLGLGRLGYGGNTVAVLPCMACGML